MPETFFEASLREASHSWRALRRRRARPPLPDFGAGVHTPARAVTFQVSLEQAEQQYRAAVAIGYESRALNLYYGLQQASRAIVAASDQFTNMSYAVNGHGLKITPTLGSAPITDLAAVQLKRAPTGKEQTDSFTRMSVALGSDLPDEFSLGDMWPLLVEPTFARNATLVTPEYEPLVVYFSDYDLQRAPSAEHRGSPALPMSLRSRPITEWPSVEEFLGRYPSLSGSESPQWPPTPDTSWQLRWQLEKETGTHVLSERLTRYRGQHMAFPTLAGRSQAMHPLMAWAAVLYSLSMLTRYAPADWAALIDIDRNPAATAIEYVLDRAVDAIPDLVDEAITKASTKLVVPAG